MNIRRLVLNKIVNFFLQICKFFIIEEHSVELEHPGRHFHLEILAGEHGLEKFWVVNSRSFPVSSFEISEVAFVGGPGPLVSLVLRYLRFPESLQPLTRSEFETPEMCRIV